MRTGDGRNSNSMQDANRGTRHFMNKATSDRVKKVVVMGGSEGAFEALLQILPAVPADVPAAFFVVVHIPVDSTNYLPTLLERRSRLRAKPAKDGETMRAGAVYVASPDHHLTIEGTTIHVRRGPRENRHRPAIDPLFRTAVRSFGSNAIAVLLSGNLDDGSAGMLAIRMRGGIGIVQDPSQAQAPGMPKHALQYAGADYVLPINEIAPKLGELITAREVATKKSNKPKKNIRDREVRTNEEVFSGEQGHGKPSVFACPECHGVLWEVKNGKLMRYRCRVGHGYTEASLQEELDQAGERALWAAMRALEERAAMTRRMLQSNVGPRDYAKRLREQVEADTSNAQIIRKMIFAEE